MAEENKEKDFANERDLFVVDLLFKRDKTNALKKAILVTEKGLKITYSGKEAEKQITELDGITVEEDVSKQINMSEVKEKLAKFFEIKKVIDTKQKCKVRISYYIWNQEKDGEIETYRYLMKKQYEELEVIDTVKEEIVE